MMTDCHANYHTIGRKRRSSAGLAAVFALFMLVATACGGGAQLIYTDGSMGVVTYPFKGGQGHLSSPFRAEALAIVEQQCRGKYTILKEGEAKGRNRVVHSAAGQDVITERRWGIRFRCE